MQTRRVTGQDPQRNITLTESFFVVDRIYLKKIVEELVGLEEIPVSRDIDIVDDQDVEWVDDRSKPEVQFDVEQQQLYKQELTNLRALKWLNEMTSDPKEISVTIQDIDRESMKYTKEVSDDPSWQHRKGNYSFLRPIRF